MRFIKMKGGCLMLLSYTIVKNVCIKRLSNSNFMSAGRMIMNNKIKQAAKLTLLIGMAGVFSGNALAEKEKEKEKQNKGPTYATTDQLASEAGVRAAADTALGQRIDNIPAGKQGDQGIQGIQGDPGTGPVGTATGDMQWWNVDHWQMIPVGENNTTLKNCDGIPTWVASQCSFSIGDTGPAGGKVFYLTDATGKHGLEAAPAGNFTVWQWGCSGTTIDGADGTAVGTGSANTADIVAGCAEANTAAKIADAYTLNGYTDWYLPSKDELNLLYAHIYVFGGFAFYGYWSSSEVGSGSAWSQDFGPGGGSGFQYHDDKNTPLAVSPIRAF